MYKLLTKDHEHGDVLMMQYVYISYIRYHISEKKHFLAESTFQPEKRRYGDQILNNLVIKGHVCC